MTNYEWIKSLDIDEMAKLIDKSCRLCIGNNDDEYCYEHGCNEGIKEWLNAKHKKPMPEIKAGDMVIYMQSQIPFYGACVYDNIVCLPGEDRCYKFCEEIKEKIIDIKRYNTAKDTMETIWRAENEEHRQDS